MTRAMVLLMMLMFVLPSDGSAQASREPEEILVPQSDSSSSKKELSILGQLWGPEVLGGYVNYYLNNRISINVGFGLNFDAHVGSNIYLVNRNSPAHSFYIGAQAITYNKFFFSGRANTERQVGIYIPLGYEYVARGGFTLQIDVGPNFCERGLEPDQHSSLSCLS